MTSGEEVSGGKMASPQTENGHIDIANELMEAFCKIRIPGEAHQVLNVIFRKTYGWHKTWDAIPLSQFVDMTGIKKPNVVRSLKILFDMNIIVIEKDNIIETNNTTLSKKITTITKYCIQKNYELWKPLSKKITVIKTTQKPLSKMIHSKETISKEQISLSVPAGTDVTPKPEKLEEPPFPPPPEEKKKPFTENDLTLAKLLSDRIRENFPNLKEKSQAQIEKWADDIRLMRTADKNTHEEIRELIEFSQQDSFWKMNILSGSTLRKQQDKLIVKIATNKERGLPIGPKAPVVIEDDSEFTNIG